MAKVWIAINSISSLSNASVGNMTNTCQSELCERKTEYLRWTDSLEYFICWICCCLFFFKDGSKHCRHFYLYLHNKPYCESKEKNKTWQSSLKKAFCILSIIKPYSRQRRQITGCLYTQWQTYSTSAWLWFRIADNLHKRAEKFSFYCLLMRPEQDPISRCDVNHSNNREETLLLKRCNSKLYKRK